MILIDFLVIWFLMNAFSDPNWDEQKGRVVLNTILITIVGGVAARYSAPYLGFLALFVWFFIGVAGMCFLATMEFKRAIFAMSIFIGYRIIFGIALSYII